MIDLKKYNALGIFGRMRADQEEFFQKLQQKYSDIEESDEAFGVFNHLTLVISKNISENELSKYKELLQELKQLLPFYLKVKGVILVDDKDLALEFDPTQTQQIKVVVAKYFPENIISAYYIKVVRGVKRENRDEAKRILKEAINSLDFISFVLCADKVAGNSILDSVSSSRE